MLKRELAHLRKQISRLDFEGLEAAKQTCADYEEKERLSEAVGDPNANIEHLRQKWLCSDCRNGSLEIFLYPKMGCTWYYRVCSNDSCKKRTKGQRYDESSVRGILKK